MKNDEDDVRAHVLVDYSPPDGPLEVIFRNLKLLVVNKPSGLLSVPGKGEHLADCLETRVKAAYPGALLVHRLDRDTSGVMVFARKPSIQRHINLQFEKRLVEKTYIADVCGDVAGEEGEIDLPIVIDWPNRPLHKICHETGKPSVTRWQVIGRSEGRTRVRLFPKTGRSHQLRVHMLSMGHPILGDAFYAHEAALAAASRLHLHAETLAFHDLDGVRRQYDCPCPF